MAKVFQKFSGIALPFLTASTPANARFPFLSLPPSLKAPLPLWGRIKQETSINKALRPWRHRHGGRFPLTLSCVARRTPIRTAGETNQDIVLTKATGTTKLFDSALVGNAEDAVEFIGNILQAPTEYSIIGIGLQA